MWLSELSHPNSLSSINNSITSLLSTETEKTPQPETDDTTDDAHRINTIFRLSVPFDSVATVDISQTDIYSQNTFKNLIRERENQNVPYFLALTKDQNGAIQTVDGTTFMRSYFKYQQTASATTRSEVQKAQIYTIDNLKNPIFQYLCDLPKLKEKSYYAKFINACDSNLAPSIRAEECYYMGILFDNSVTKRDPSTPPFQKDTEKAFFWYNKSAGDGYFGAHIALANWYENGNDKVRKSEKEFIHHLESAAHCLPLTDPKAQRIHQALTAHHKEKNYSDQDKR